MSLLNTRFNPREYKAVVTPKPNIVLPSAVIPQPVVEKADKESIAQNPLAMAYATMNTQFGLKTGNGITMQTLRRMSRTNWVDRTCIFTLRDEITAIPWDITPIDPKKPFNEKFQQYAINLLKRPNRNNENWRTLLDKVTEDILVVDAGCIEKVRNDKGLVVELYHVDGTTIKPVYDLHGVVGDPAYLQFLPDKKSPVAEFENDDLVRMVWNPQGAIDLFGWGLSPVEAGLAVGTAFLYAEAYNLGFFRTNTIPPVLINMGKDVNANEVEKFRSFLASEMMGDLGFHQPIIGSFADGFDIKELMKAPTEMGFKEYVEWQMRWKVALYRMSPQDIGFTLDQYKTEGQVQQQLSKNKAIDSLKGVIAEYINTEILGDESFDGLNTNLQFTWIDAESVNPLKQAQIDEIYLKNGVNSINEVRQVRGFDPIKGGIKPMLIAGTDVAPIDPTPISDDEEVNDEDKEDSEETEKHIEKNFVPSGGQIADLTENPTAIAWMDDRGVTQPFFVTDFGKTKGFTIKASFLDDKKDQTPPEQEVSEMLRLLKVNTPEVKIMSYDEVIRLLPNDLYGDFTKWINLEAPYNSQQWRDRWGATRKSDYYIVTGYINAVDLGNEGLQEEMRQAPESYLNAVKDLARVWLAERRFYLGDRKPGHYLITKDGDGFGVDYQFYEDKNSWDKTNHFLPDTLEVIHPLLKKAFVSFVEDQAGEFGIIQKALKGKPQPSDWDKMSEITEIEKKIATTLQKKIFIWYQKATGHIKATKRPLVLQKSQDFNPNESYITNGEWVYQNGIKYPVTVLDQANIPSSQDLQLSVIDYRDAYDQGVIQAQLGIERATAQNLKVRNPELYAPMFEKRINYLADTMDNSMKKMLDSVIVKGIDEGLTYGQIADEIQQALGVDPNNPDFPLYRAERVARTESMWAINEGMRNQYAQVGIKKVNVDVAPTACDLCASVAHGNPYTLNEAEGVVPVHPNCRCVLVGDWSDILD